MSNDVGLVQQIVEWFELERVNVLRIATAAGLGATVGVRTTVVTPRGDDGASAGVITKAVNPLRVRSSERIIRREFVPVDTSEIAKALYSRFDKQISHFSAFVNPRFDEDPVGWIDSALLLPALYQYLTRLESLDLPNPEAARQIAIGVIDLAGSDHVYHVTFLPLAGLRVGEHLQSFEATLRPLTADELSGLARGVMEGEEAEASFFRSGLDYDIPFERSALIVRNRTRKDQQPLSDLLIHRILLAFQLRGFNPHGRARGTLWTEPGPSLLSGGHQFKLARSGEVKDVTQADLEAAVLLAHKIPPETFSDPKTGPAIALHRFSLAIEERHPAEALINFVISLEALLLPGSKEGELRFRFALHGAKFGGRDMHDRKALFRELRRIYDIRSRLVHGSNLEDANTLYEAHKTARVIAARLILKALESGWPTADSFLDLVLA